MNELDLFTQALALTDPAEQLAFLDRVCVGNLNLRLRLDELLAAHAQSNNPLDRPAVPVAEPGVTSDFPAAPAFSAGATGSFDAGGNTGTFTDGPTNPKSAGAASLGSVIAGRYTLVEMIGEGGMGRVYRAEQTEPVKRQVALKVIRAGMDSRTVLARFEAERQALALMDHPNIARVFDGGTTATGQPFFVMELIEGVPITDYCDRKRLGVRARLELFVAVCQAVQHAHQKGIIHRDLKPGNVLVTEVDGRPTPKVIDFGVAKATEQKLTDMSFADTGAIVGTPAYMSPEQADPSSMDIDTRTDVYALGVILYELLVGSPPLDTKQFQRGAVLEMMRMVREVDPPRPSTKLSTADALPNIAANRNIEPAQLKRALRGDLDWIVMKSLEKDRTRRYDSANGFAADVLRHLAYEPVLAAPPGQVYRVRKFVRKNRGAVAAASLVVLALVCGIVGTSWGLWRADQALIAEAKRVKERDEALSLAQDALGKRDVALGEARTATDDANRRGEELKYRLGVSDMVLASSAYDNSNVSLAAERLNRIPIDQRGWEWNYQHRLTRGGLFTLYGHTSEVRCAAFSPDGTCIATCSFDSTVRIWDAHTGVQIRLMEGHSASVSRLCFSPDGTRLATTGKARGMPGEVLPGEVKVWDVWTGKVLLELKGRSSQVIHVAYSPNGQYLATGEGKGVLAVWDAHSGALQFSVLADEYACSLAYSPDGTRIVTSGNGRSLKIWDASTWIMRAEFKNVGSVWDVAFSPDGTRIAFASGQGFAKVLDAETGRELILLEGHTAAVECVAFSPDGSRIVTGSHDTTAKVWDAQTGRHLLELKGHRMGEDSGVGAASFSPDGTRIVTASGDRTAKVWDAWTGGAWTELVQNSACMDKVAFDPDGTRLLTASRDKFARVWEVRTGRMLLELRDVLSVALSPDGTRLACGYEDGTTKIWDSRTGALLIDLKGHADRVSGLSFSPDGTKVVTCSREPTEEPTDSRYTARVWDVRSGTVLNEMKTQDFFTDATFSPDGAKIVTFGTEAIVRDAQTGACLLRINGHPSSGTQCARFSPDGRQIVTGSWDGTARLWDSCTGKLLSEFKGHGKYVHSVAFSPDGKRIITGSWDKTIRVWEARTGASLLELRGHGGPVWGVTFSPDGTLIASASGDGTVRLWDGRSRSEGVDLEEDTFWYPQVSFSPDGGKVIYSLASMVKIRDARTGAVLIELKGHTADVTHASFSHDGTKVITGSEDTTARIWDASTGSLLAELKGHTGSVRDAEFSPAGSKVVTAGDDKTTRIWDEHTGKELVRITHDELVGVWFSSDGAQIVTQSANQTKVWDANTGEVRNDVPVPEYRSPGPISPDGRFFLYTYFTFARIVPLHPTSDEIADRITNTRPDVRRYLAGLEDAKRNNDRHASRFYLDRLLSLRSERTTDRLRERNTTVSDPRLIARTGFHHPALAAIPYDHEVILFQAAKGDRLAQRLVAQEFLRDGKPSKAVPLLVWCLLRRPDTVPPAPPVEELLLAQAYLDLHQPEEAARHYRTAVEWLDRTVLPVRAANIASHSLLNPLVGLAAAVTPVEDRRRNPFDWEPWHECDVFRDRVEKQLRAKP